ncbi:hypothetical protein IAU59_007480 [Kwoniella sp. CBS 9459]
MTINRAFVPFLASLTTLFILLPGISGRKVGFHWLRVACYGSSNTGHASDDADSVGPIPRGGLAAAGNESDSMDGTGSGVAVWDLGSLGSCPQVGWGGMSSSCEFGGADDPPHWHNVQSVLVFHLAAATLFFITACLSSILFHFPEASITRRWGTLVPLLNVLWPAIVMIADLAIAHSVEIEEDVSEVKRIGVFWLGTASFVLSIFWCLTIQLEGARKRLLAGDEKPIIEEEDVKHEGDNGWADKAGQAIWRAWPWSGDDESSRKSRSKKRTNGDNRGRKGKHGHEHRSSRKQNER